MERSWSIWRLTVAYGSCRAPPSRDFVDAVESLGTGPNEIDDKRGDAAVLRTYGVGAQILRELGLSKMRVLSAPKQMYAISGFDLEVTEYVEN